MELLDFPTSLRLVADMLEAHADWRVSDNASILVHCDDEHDARERAAHTGWGERWELDGIVGYRAPYGAMTVTFLAPLGDAVSEPVEISCEECSNEPGELYESRRGIAVLCGTCVSALEDGKPLGVFA